MSDASEKLADVEKNIHEYDEHLLRGLRGVGNPDFYDPAEILGLDNVDELNQVVYETMQKSFTVPGGTPKRADAYESGNLLTALARDEQVASRSRLRRLAAAATELDRNLRTGGHLVTSIKEVGQLP
jgi:hypothetical protein